MKTKVPILLSFYALSNGDTLLTFGQIAYTGLEDLSFREYSRRKTFRTLLKLYRTRPYANREIILVFSTGTVKASTNRHGAFYIRSRADSLDGSLVQVVLGDGKEAKIVDGLYRRGMHYMRSDTLIVSDIDDTLVDSFIHDRVLQVRTLMFTAMEKRKAVAKMQHLMKDFAAHGAVPIYLSNSEQNLYPLIYRFLRHNDFPEGPLLLKQMRKLWDVVTNVKFPPENAHKVMALEELMELFPGKKFILMGDNTQHDVSIYLAAAEKYGDRVRCIIIRKVVEKKSDDALIREARENLQGNGVSFYYSDQFPDKFEL